MSYVVFDLEGDGLRDTITKIHCISYCITDGKEDQKVVTTTDKKEIEEVLNNNTIVGHNIIRYDIPVLKKFGYNITNKNVIDTLNLSWFVNYKNKSHSLESYENQLGIKKVEINDWHDDTFENYKLRCETDVLMQVKLFKILYSQFLKIQRKCTKSSIAYLNFKTECLDEHENEEIELNVDLCKSSLNNLQELYDYKKDLVGLNMPEYHGKIIATRPKKLYKSDGTLSLYGQKWIDNYGEDVEIVYEKNPTSTTQLKKWLFELGWTPITFKKNSKKTDTIPQISLPNGGGLCPSVKALYDVEPSLENLDGIYIIKHRIGVLKGFLDKGEKTGSIRFAANGYTNTLRLKHAKPIANLPKPGLLHSETIRECMTVPNGYLMCGVDISGLEDNTKQHYLYTYDPEYVKELQTPGFCPHLDLGLKAGLLTLDEVAFYKTVDNMTKNEKNGLSESDKKFFEDIKERRTTSKVANFACTYNAYPPTIAATAKITLAKATTLFEGYHQRNWALGEIVKNTHYERIGNQLYLYNTVSNMFVNLKKIEDIFSTLNQSTGVFVFDNFLNESRINLHKLNINIPFQYHDEYLFKFLEEQEQNVIDAIIDAEKSFNEKLKMNVKFKVSTSIGKNYKECH